jgi:hypothetical protein
VTANPSLERTSTSLAREPMRGILPSRGPSRFRPLSSNVRRHNSRNPHRYLPSSASQPQMNLKLFGVAAALALGLVLAFMTLVVLALVGVREETLGAMAGSLGPAIAGLLIVGWKKPELFLSPIPAAWSWLNKRLTRRSHRTVFLLSLLVS